VNTPLPVTGDVGVNNFPPTQNVSFNGAAQPVTFSSTSAHPLFTSDVNAGLFTHDGQKSSNLVTLTTRGFSCGTSCPFMQIAGDGSAVPSACNGSVSYCVPSNEVLVVTDMQWTCEGGTPGNTSIVTLLPSASTIDELLAVNASVNADGVAGGSVSLTGGVVIGPGQAPQVHAFSGCTQINGAGGGVVSVHGYLAPNV
jgi:hypothetical protein